MGGGPSPETREARARATSVRVSDHAEVSVTASVSVSCEGGPRTELHGPHVLARGCCCPALVCRSCLRVCVVGPGGVYMVANPDLVLVGNGIPRTPGAGG